MALFRSPTMLIAYSRARLNINIMNCIHKDNIAFRNPHEPKLSSNCVAIVSPLIINILYTIYIVSLMYLIVA